MKMQKLLAAAAMVFLTSAGAASAASLTVDGYTVDGTITVTTQSFTGNAPSITNVLNISGPPVGSGLPTGVQNFFTANPASCYSGSPGNHCVSTGTAMGTIQVVFTFEEMNGSRVVSTGSLTQDGTFQANYSGSLDCSSSRGQSDCIYWKGTSSTQLTPTADGSTYNTSGDRNNQSTTASVIDLVTLANGTTFDVNFFDAQDWDITPGVSFTNLDPATATPLPAALPLFAGGLGVLGFAGSWRRRRAAKATASI
jgi:hypothetical protein